MCVSGEGDVLSTTTGDLRLAFVRFLWNLSDPDYLQLHASVHESAVRELGQAEKAGHLLLARSNSRSPTITTWFMHVLNCRAKDAHK